MAYVDSTISLPLLIAYCLSRVKSLNLKIGTVTKIKTSRKIAKRGSAWGACIAKANFTGLL